MVRDGFPDVLWHPAVRRAGLGVGQGRATEARRTWQTAVVTAGQTEAAGEGKVLGWSPIQVKTGLRLEDGGSGLRV